MERRQSVPIHKETVHAREQLRRRRVEGVKRRRRVRAYSFFVLLVFLFIVAVWFGNSDRFKIKDVSVEGNAVVQSSNIVSIAQKNLTGRYFLIFSNRNAFLYPKEKIEQEIKSSLGYVSEVKLERRGFNKLVIFVAEREAKYIACDLGLKSNSQCYLVDRSGLLFAPAGGRFENVLFMIQSNLPAKPLGQQLLNKDDFANLEKAIASLPQLFAHAGIGGLDSDLVSVSPVGDYIFEVRQGSGSNWELRWHHSSDLPTIARRLKALWASSDFQSDIKSGNLQYVDLRFGKKVFYKLDSELSPRQE